jgi:hypothetical protein
LEHLDLTNHLVGADGIRALARSETLLGLRSLDLDHDPSAGSDENRFDAEALIALSEAPNLSGLTSLRLCPHELSEAASEALARSPYLRGLRSLGLAAGDYFANDHEIRPLLGSPFLAGLERLDLRGMPVNAEDVEALAASPAPAGLRSLSLNLEHCGIAAVEALLDSPWASGLRQLTLCNAPGRDVDLERSPVMALAKAASLAGLRELDLRSVPVGDEQLATLAESPHLSRLVSLKLGYTTYFLTEAGIRRLAESPALPALRRLSCRGFGRRFMVAALAGTPLASRLTALNLRAQHLSPDDVRPLLDRSRWPRLVRLDLAENQDLDEDVCGALLDRWGAAIRLDDEHRQYEWYD